MFYYCPRCLTALKETAEGRRCEACGFAVRIEPAGEERVLRWEDGGEDGLVFVHPQGGSIPARSALEVRENQIAMYRAGGMYYEFAEPGLYPLFYETRDEGDIVAGLYEGELASDRLPAQLDTALVFFSARAQAVRFAPETPLPAGESGFAVRPRIEARYRISSPRDVLANGAVYPLESAALRSWIETGVRAAVTRRLAATVSAYATDEFLRDEGASRRFAARLAKDFADVDGTLLREAQRDLDRSSIGVTLLALSTEWTNAVHTSSEAAGGTASLAECPACGSLMEDVRTDTLCPKCGERLHWCAKKGGYFALGSRGQCPYCFKTILL